MNNMMLDQGAKYCLNSLKMSTQDIMTKKKANECLQNIKKMKKTM